MVMDVRVDPAFAVTSRSLRRDDSSILTELGPLPSDWKVVQVQSVCELVVDCKNRTPPVVEGGEYAVVRTPNVRSGKFVRDELRFTDKKSFLIWTARAVPRPDDVMITREAPTGEVCLVPTDVSVCLGQRMMLYRPNRTQIYPKYLLHSLMSDGTQSYLFKRTGGSTVGHAKVDDIRTLLIALPSTVEEQAGIAAALSDVDTLIDGLEALIDKKRRIKLGMTRELLSGQRRLPGFTGEWNYKRLRTDATLKARIGWQGLTTAEYLEKGEFRLVTGTEFRNGRVHWGDCYFVDEKRYKQDFNIQLKCGDVLVTKDGTIGKVAFVSDLPTPATLNSGVFVIRPKSESFDSRFLYYILGSSIFTAFLDKLSAGSTINHLYQKDFVDFTFRAPSDLKEQKSIAAVLSSMDDEIQALDQKLKKAALIKQGMMQQLLTGKVRLA